MSKYAPMAVLWGIVVAIYCSNSLVPQAYGLEESTAAGGSNAVAVHNLGETGQDVNVGLILLYNARITHEAFKDSNGISHAFNYDYSGSGILINWHDTQLAGIIASRGGDLFPNDIGVAPGTDLHCARVADWYGIRDAINFLINTHNCRVFVTGFEFEPGNPAADGNSFWTMLYDYFAYERNVIFTNAAGNQNTVITIFGDAYNGITTGGLRLNDVNNEFDYRRVGRVSGAGQTADGRRKPETTAPSQSQTVPTDTSDTAWTTAWTSDEDGETSWSVPHTAGAAALLLGLADDTPGPNDNRGEVIKAVLVNSAMPNINDKNGSFTNPADSNNTWQNQRGYGRLDALRAYQTLDTNEVEPDVNILQDRGWGFGRLNQGQTNTYTISVATRCRLIATITWHRRIAWTDKPPKNGRIDVNELAGFLADLDMVVYSPYEPNAIFTKELFGYSPKDNLIKCDLLVLTPGDYTITLENNSDVNEPANYGFAFELHPVMPADLNDVDYTVDMNDLGTLMQDWLEDSQFDEMLSPNGIIDFADFVILAESWLQTDPFYYSY